MLIDNKNIENYFISIQKELPFSCSFVNASPVTEHSYVNNVYKITVDVNNKNQDIYLRQALDHIKAQPELKVPPQRIFYEGKILNKLNSIFENEVVPKVLYTDKENCLLVLHDIRRGADVLVDQLDKGILNIKVARSIGSILGELHGKTWNAQCEDFFSSKEMNERNKDLHYHNRLKEAKAEFPDIISRLVEDGKKDNAFVIGDFISKNIIVEGDNIRFLDLERSFIGDPLFDIGFLLCHYEIAVCNNIELQADFDEFKKLLLEIYFEELDKYGVNYDKKSFKDRIDKYIGATIFYRLYDKSKSGVIKETAKDLLREKAVKYLKI